KDSMSMRTVWEENGQQKAVTSPLSLIISAFAPVSDIRKTVTPQLRADIGHELLLVDLGGGRNRLGASALAQVYGQLGHAGPDIDPETLKRFFTAMQLLLEKGLVVAAHDRSDGGLVTTLLEMAFAGRCGLDIDADTICNTSIVDCLFAEELGAVIQVSDSLLPDLMELAEDYGLGDICLPLGRAVAGDSIRIDFNGETVLQDSRSRLQQLWAETSYRMQAAR